MRLVISLLCFFSFSSICAESSVIGRVYDIKEEDEAIKVLKKADAVNWASVFNEPHKKADKWLKSEQVLLPYAEKDSVRFHVPHYVVEKPVIDKHGNVIYPKGYRFNPLNFTKLPFRVVVVDLKSLIEFKSKIRKNDMIVLSSGDLSQAEDIIGKKCFILNEKLKAKLNINVIPSFVEQQNNMLHISEFKFDEEMINEKY